MLPVFSSLVLATGVFQIHFWILEILYLLIGIVAFASLKNNENMLIYLKFSLLFLLPTLFRTPLPE
jgi:hypothetical protein